MLPSCPHGSGHSEHPDTTKKIENNVLQGQIVRGQGRTVTNLNRGD